MATAAHLVDEADDLDTDSGGPLATLAQIVQIQGDISSLFDAHTLVTIGSDVVRDYELDLAEQDEWRQIAERSLKRASQEREALKNPPPYRRSNVNYPILAIAALQFNARAYPAICKPGSMVKCSVVGSDKGRPQTDEQGNPLVSLNGQPVPMQQAQQMVAQQAAQTPPPQPGQPAPPPPDAPQPLWQIPPGAKQARADRVAEYMNVYLQYRMDNWEEDTDQLLFEVPIVGCGFRKLWWDADDGLQRAAYVSALDLVVPIRAKTLEDCPRITERLNDVFPFQIKRRMNSGEYRYVELTSTSEDEEEPRLLLESHRWLDLDEDGVDEPYIVTVDHETTEVLRIVANFSADDVKLNEQGQVASIDKTEYYIKYPFLPNPKGIFYGTGFGQLVEQLGDIIDTSINQMNDAGHAAIAGGGFIAAGVRLQGNNRNEVIRFQPGEYKQVSVAGGDLRNGIVERTFPQPSKIMYDLMEMMLAAAKDITSVKDILTGDVPNTAPVGTTLAIVQQAQTVFTAIYKRIYRAVGQEFGLIYDNLSKFGGDTVAQDYSTVLDDIKANFEQDFADSDMDIKPVADPANVTPMQQVAKAQFLMGFLEKGLNDMAILKNALEAGGIADIDQYLPQGPAQPDPLTLAKVRQMQTASDLNEAKANQAGAVATKTAVDIGHSLGASHAGASVSGGVSGLGGGLGNSMGGGGAGQAGGGSGGDLGAGIVQPGGA